MQVLPLSRVDSITRSVPDEFLEHLVAIFSKQTDDDLLLVYLDAVPPSLPAGCGAITLDELPNQDLLAYDGLIVAFPSIDVIRADIPTKGLNFYPMDRFLRKRGRFALLRRSWEKLGAYLADLLEQRREVEVERERVAAEIDAISAPGAISRLGQEERRRMVAFLPGRERAVPIDALGDPTLIPRGETIIALEEVRLDPEDRFALELRTVLRKSRLDEHLLEIRSELASALYRRWEEGGVEHDRERASSLALERRLATEDVDDLVAVLPAARFEDFRTGGAGVYVYRTLPEGRRGSEGHGVCRLELEELLDAGQPQVEREVVFSLFPLRPLLEALGLSAGTWCDLGPVLHKAGKTEVLARNAWLLVQDMVEWPREQRDRFQVALVDLLETIMHSCALFSLADPWRFPRGRYIQMRAGAYSTLHTVLERLIQTTEGRDQSYYRALDEWYGCARSSSDTIEAALDRMLGFLRAFERAPVHPSRQGDRAAEQAKRLHHVGIVLAQMLRSGARAAAIPEFEQPERPAGSVPRIVRQAAAMGDTIELPTQLFRNAFHQYCRIIQWVQQTRAAQMPVDDRIRRFHDAERQLEQTRRLIFALYHEARILERLYDRAIEETRKLADELQGGASLTVELLTRSATQDEDSQIVLALRNIGRVSARQVEVELAGTEHFQFRGQSFRQMFPRLRPDEEQRVAFAIRPQTDRDAFPVRLAVSYHDARSAIQQQTMEFDVRLISLDRGPFQKKPNPYVYGVPLQTPGRFYGRQKELDDLLSHLAFGFSQNILLRGARRTGKTSILNMLRLVINDRGGQNGARARFDVPRDWCRALDRLHPLSIDLQKLDRRGGQISPTTFYHAILRELRQGGLGSDRIEGALEEPYLASREFERLLAGALRAHPGLRLVLLVDEFDVLDLGADKDFYAQFRAVISNVQAATWIIASALGLYKEVRDYESPLFNVFKIVELGRLDREAARRLILAPWQAREDNGEQSPGLQVTDDAIEAILDESGGYPYFIQLLCSAIVEHVNAIQTNYVRHGTVFEVIEEIIAPRSTAYEHFAYLWERAGGLGKAILLTLMSSSEPRSRPELERDVLARLRQDRANVPPSAVKARYEANLRRLEVVEAIRLNRSNRYIFGVPLLRRLLVERSEREDLWALALAEIGDEFEGGEPG